MLLTAEWVLPISGPPIKNGAVLVRNGLIEKVGEAGSIKKESKPEKEIAFEKAILMPGLVDAHTHLEYSVFRGVCKDVPFSQWKLQLTEKSRLLSGADWEKSAALGALEAVQSGITCIADITGTGASFRAALKTGLRGSIFYEVSEMNAAKTDETIKKAGQKISAWKKEAAGSRLSIGISPYSVYNVAPPIFREVARYSHEQNLILALHLAGSKDEYNFVKYGAGPLAVDYRKKSGWEDILWQPLGVSPVKYVENWDVFDNKNVIAIHCIQVNDHDIDVLKRYDVRIVHCPKCSSKLGMGIAPLGKFIQRGLTVALGTDSPASNNTMDLFDEMRIGLLLQRGQSGTEDLLSAENFVEMATLGGAKALGISSRVGTLEAGKEADIIAVDISSSHQQPVHNPYTSLVYGANQENILMTMIGGDILYQDRETKIVDSEVIINETESIRLKLTG